MREVSDWSLTVGALMLWGIFLWAYAGSLDSFVYWRLYGIAMLLLGMGVVTRVVLGVAWAYRKIQGA